jgi:hypothetical protein
MGHLMMENRNGLIVDARLTEANGTAERSTALDMIECDFEFVISRLESSRPSHAVQSPSRKLAAFKNV